MYDEFYLQIKVKIFWTLCFYQVSLVSCYSNYIFILQNMSSMSKLATQHVQCQESNQTMETIKF